MHKTVLKDREEVVEKIMWDLDNLYAILCRLDINKFNKTAVFPWKKISNGYTETLRIFDRRDKWHKKIVVYDIEDKSCFERIIDKEDDTIFKVIKEANSWIAERVEVVREKVSSFSERYEKYSKKIEEIIDDQLCSRSGLTDAELLLVYAEMDAEERMHSDIQKAEYIADRGEGHPMKQLSSINPYRMHMFGTDDCSYSMYFNDKSAFNAAYALEVPRWHFIESNFIFTN